VLDKHWAFTLTSSLFKILKRVGFNRLGKEGKTLTHKVYYRNSKHEIYHYLDLLSIIKKKTDYSDTKLDITLTRKDTLGASKLLDKTKNYYVLINSGGNNVGEQSNIRKMPRKLFKELVEKISKKNKIIFLGTDSERTYYEKFILNKKCFNLAGQTSLKESVSILKKAKRVITTDSGPMHMASAVNNKIISVFGSTNPKRKAPLNKGAKAIWKDKKIYEEKYEIFGKKPKNKQFMKTITSEEVLNLL